MTAVSSARRTGCHVMAKPTGAVCNIDCQYCFYLEKEKLYPDRKQQWKMDDSTLEQYIKQQIEAQDTPEVTIAWQGGEPTLMGLDFFRRAVEIQQRYDQGRRVTHALQTNGLLLNDQWCRFFKQHNFLVGISIDGPADLHDAYRVNRAGKPTHAKVMAAIACLKKHGVEFNALTVVNARNARQPRRVYEFLKSAGIAYIQFIPIVERRAQQQTEHGLQLVAPGYDRAADVTDWSVSAKDYGNFLTEIFDIWVHNDVGRVFVQLFDTTLATTCGYPASVCLFAETCGNAFALEANGDLYSCDHFVYPEHKLGNIHQTTIRALNHSPQAKQFGENKKHSLPQECLRCAFRQHCHGGCPKHRFLLSAAGKPDLNYFCAAYQQYFAHSAPYMRVMGDLLARQRPAADIMAWLKYQPQRHQAAAPARNAACPCGSGRKFKRCCGQ